MTVAEGKYEYASESSLHSSYLKNSKAIGVLWGVFTLCFAIIAATVFVQPHWLGDTPTSKGTGHFGLWQACRMVQDGQEVVCEGSLADFGSIPSAAFRAATVFVGLALLTILLCICCMLLFFVFHSSTVFHICGWMQVFCACCLSVGVVSWPAGWDAPSVREVCGPAAGDFRPGDCGLRWAFVLAVIAVADCAVLAALAFVLGTRYVKLLPDTYITASTQLCKGEVNSAFLTDQNTPPRKSTNLQPAMVVPPGVESDHYSEYSHRSSKAYRQDNFGGNSVANFQL